MPTTSAQAPCDETGQRLSLSEILDQPNLPSPPALVLQIVEKVSQPDCNPNDVIALLNKDSGLCCQVLKTVNSGLYGLTRPASSLKQAVAMLGLRPLRSLVLSLALPAIRSTDRDEVVVRYWQESVAGAVIARGFAQLLGRKDPDDDLLAGLLRDLGVLVLRQAYDDDYLELRRRNAEGWGTRQCALEQDAFGADHAEISAALLESWKLPEEIVAPVRWHHEPAGDESLAQRLRDRANVLCFASKVAMLGTDASITVSELVQWAHRQFAVSQVELIRFLGTITPAIQEFAALLKVDIGGCPNYAGIIADGCQELVRLSYEPTRVSPPNRETKAVQTDPSVAMTQDTRPQQARQVSLSSRNGNHGAPPVEFDVSWLDHVPEGGATMDGYRIESLIGRGGMGVVFKAHDKTLHRHVAIKMLRPEGVVLTEGRQRFLQEARAVAAIQHENVVTIFAVGEVNGLPYLVMEYVPGMSLQDQVDKQGRLPIEEIIRFGRQIALGLSAAHRRHMIHRDIKPANILIASETGSAKITDFGLARLLDQQGLTGQGAWVGTPQYMAPEQFEGGGDMDHRADLFSLGSLLYTLSAGRPPFLGNTILSLMNQISTKAAAPLRSVRPDLPAWLIELINKLHAKAPAHRYQSATDVVRAFDAHG